MKKLFLILIAIILMVVVGCDVESSTSKEREQTELVMDQMMNEVGMPDIQNFYEKKLAKEIFELRDDSELVCYAYTVNLDGQFVYIGRCMGYGLPYSVQYTNPDKISRIHTGGDYHVISQPDPNGLYMPDGLSATWVMLINEKTGDREIMYFEPYLAVYQSKLPRRLVADWSLPADY